LTEEFATKNPKTVEAILKALHEASVWLDDLGNRPEQCEIVSKPTYINYDAKIILGRLHCDHDYGDGRKVKDETPMRYSRRNCN
jgi:nitrate/nitrite transport system substrate-binding protein